MYRQEENRSARLAREKHVYRYTTALETGDIDTIASLWHKAEHDATLERMLLETQSFYMNEGARAVAIDKELAAEVLESTLLTPVSIPVQEKIEIINEHSGSNRHYRLPKMQRVSQVGAFVQSLVAVLVVGLILGGFLVLFASRHGATVGSSTKNISWGVVASLDGQQSHNTLFDVAAVSASDVWAVGATSDQSPDMFTTQIPTGTQALIEHWNGSQWQIVPNPKVGTQGNLLNSVAAISASNIWAVGNYSNSSNPSQNKTLIEHWDGTQWSVVASPNPGMNNDELSAISVVSPDDIWAVGTLIESNAQQHALIEHWNGSQWQAVSSPGIQQKFDFLNSVTAIASNNIWASGFSADSKFTNVQTLIEHWNGSQWQIMSSLNPGRSDNILEAVTAVSANNIWAVGQANYTGQTGRVQTLVEHWNGTQWSVVASPSAGKFHDMLFSVTAITTNNIWALGLTATNQNASTWQPLIEHWDGTQWSIVASPQAGISRNIEGMTSVPGTNQLWVVGGTLLNTDKEQTLTEIGTF